MPYQPPFGYVVPPQGRLPQDYHYHPKGSVQNPYSGSFQQSCAPSQSYIPNTHYSPSVGPHEGGTVYNSQNHLSPSWPAPMGPPPNRYTSPNMSSRQPATGGSRAYTDEDFIRETDSQPFTPSRVHNPAPGGIVIDQNSLRDMDDLIHGFRPTMTPIPTANPHWELNRARVASATPRIPVEANLVHEIDDLLHNFELEPNQSRRPSWGPHRTRQAVRAETPRIAVDRKDLDDMDALLRNFNPEPILPQMPVQGRKSSWVAEGRRRRSSTVGSASAGFSPPGNDDTTPNEDKQSPVSQKRKARFAYMTDSWEPKKPQKRRPSNPERISKGLLENSGCDWSRLKPGSVHLLVANSAFTKASTRTSRKNLPPREESVKYLPRSKEFSGKNHSHHLILSVCGMPGPYIMDLVEENVDIDGDDDDIFSGLGVRESKFKIDWPGLNLPPIGFKVLKSDGQRHRRGDLALSVATRIAKLIIDIQQFGKRPPTPQVIDGETKDWDLKKVDVTRIRIVSLNYFISVKAWVPVLAVDALDRKNHNKVADLS